MKALTLYSTKLMEKRKNANFKKQKNSDIHCCNINISNDRINDANANH